jgi:hypothetical protein
MAELNEVAADVVEEIAENGVELAEALRGVSTRAAAAATSLGLLAGAFAGYFVAMKRLEDKYAAVAEDEIDSMREHFRKQLIARDEKPNLGDLGKKIEELSGMRSTRRSSRRSLPVRASRILRMFLRQSRTSSRTTPQSSRTPVGLGLLRRRLVAEKHAYVIHLDERGQEDAYDEITLTYYQGDDVLCDAEDKVIDDQERVVGVENLDKFGHGSNDVNVVYVRNDAMQLDIEIVKSDKTYAEEVHGLAHADNPPRRRRTEWDE